VWRPAIAGVVVILACAAAGKIYLRNRDWRDEVAFYTSTLKVSPSAYYMHNNLGTVYWQRGNVAEAKREWGVAYRLAPTSEYVLHNLGLAANTERDYPRAKEFYLAALRFQPNYSDAHLDLGSTYQAMGQTQDAEAEFVAAERLSPLSLRVHNTLSEFYADQRNLEPAKAEARKSIDIQPTIQAYWDLGMAEWLEEDRAGAEKAFQSALALSPESARAHFMLGLLYMDSNRNPEAIREYRAVLKINPANVEAAANLQKLEFLTSN
jgi:tetratricopeptide (TPR) repeat protein